MRSRAEERGPNGRLWRVEHAAFVAGARPRPLPGASAYLHPQVPEVWDASFVSDLHPPLDLDRLLSKAAALFATAGCAHQKIWLHDPTLFPSIGAALVARGFSERRMVIMSASTEPRPPLHSPPEGLCFTLVRTRGERRLLARARHESRRDAPWYGVEVAAALDRWEDIQARTLDLQWIFASLGDRPAGAVGLLVTDEGASLQSLATAVDLRRRGIGEALIARVRWLARGRGHTTLSLLTDLDSRPHALYRRLGFVDRVEVRAYERATP